MNLKKRIFALLLAVMLLASLSIPAFAVSAQYATTRAFLNALDDKNLKYTYVGIDNDDDEKVTISYSGDYKDTIKVNCFFDPDLDTVSLYVWNLIDFNEADYNKVLRSVDELNNDYKYATFCVDQSDWSVTAKYSMHIRTNSICGEMVLDEVNSLVNVADIGYDTLQAYAK